jgi:hypothetical protein
MIKKTSKAACCERKLTTGMEFRLTRPYYKAVAADFAGDPAQTFHVALFCGTVPAVASL